MNTILIIQPHKMLQHAIALSLFPQYQTRMIAAVPVAGEIQDVDAVIVDAASLRESHGLTPQAMAWLRDWDVPMVWIDNADSSLVPAREKLIVVERPIGRQSLQKALAECLDESSKPAGEGNRPVRDKKERPTPHTGVDKNIVQSEVIDLVDVVQEAPKPKEVSRNK